MTNKNKKAFSMIEILIVLVIIGFILIAELIIINNKANNYGQPYYTTYNSLKKTAYNVLADMYCPGSTCPVAGLEFPRTFPETSLDVCTRFAEFLNIAQNNCATMTPITNAANNNEFENPHLVLSNSYKVYFGTPNKYIWTNPTTLENQEFNYFVVYVDLNGEKAPNRITCTGTQVMPDIVPFAVTQRGEVVPMGYPVYSKLYATAKIKYPAEAVAAGGTFDPDSLTDRTSGSMSFYDAIYGAWPDSTDPSNPTVFKHVDIPYSLMFSDETAFNKSNIRQCYDDTITSKPDELMSEAEYKMNAPNREAEGCVGGTYNCRVILDSNINTRY